MKKSVKRFKQSSNCIHLKPGLKNVVDSPYKSNPCWLVHAPTGILHGGGGAESRGAAQNPVHGCFGATACFSSCLLGCQAV